MMDEEIARMRAEMDQAREGLKEYTATLWTFYSELLEQGFTEAQALRLTVQFVKGASAGGGES
jgi:hypothetical protein